MTEPVKLNVAIESLRAFSRLDKDKLSAGEVALYAAAIECLSEAMGIESPVPEVALLSMGLGISVTRPLSHEGMLTTADVCKKTPSELLNIRNFGVTALNKLRVALKEHGLFLRGDRLPHE